MTGIAQILTAVLSVFLKIMSVREQKDQILTPKSFLKFF